VRDPVRWLGALAVVLVALAAVGLVRLGDRDDLTAKGIERLLAYELDRPISFALQPGERQIRLLTWLVTEPADLADDRASETYAIAVRLTDAAGAPALERTLWVSTHPAWLPHGTGLRPERLFPSARQVWADRTTHLDVADLAPLGGTVEISPVRVPPGGSLLMVAHRRADAGSLAILRTMRRGDLDAGDPIAPWSMSVLPTSWQENAARVVWERLGALPPESGGVAPTARLETTFRTVPGVTGPAAGSPVWPGGALVWLLDGLTTFTATLSPDYGATLLPGPGVVRVRKADGTETVEAVVGSIVGPVACEGPTEITFALDATADGPRWVVATTRGGPRDRAQGDPPRVEIDEERQAVAPDFRQVDAWRVLPGDPVDFPIRAGEHVKLMVRRPLGAGVRPGLGIGRAEEASTLSLVALAADGAEIGAWPVSFTPIASAFERYVRGDDEGDTRVSEPLPVYVRPPEGAVALRISTDATADVSLSVTDQPDVPGVVLPDYAVPGDFPWEVRYEPHVERGWRARAPADEERLALSGRSVAIDGQVRWIPREPAGTGTTAADKDSLDLAGPFELLAEPATVGTKGGRVRLGDGPTVVRLPPSGRLEIDWRVPLASVGRWVRVVAGGRTVMRQLHAAGGTLRVDGLGTAPIEVSVVVEGEGARRGLFLARATGDPAWQVRRVWRVAEDREIAIDVPAGASSISVDVYRVGQAGQVRWRVEPVGPDPVGASLVSTRRAGAAGDPWSEVAAALPLSFDGVPLTRLRPIIVSRPEGSTAATLVLRPEGSGGRVWVRAQSTWAASGEPATRHARRPAAAP